MENKAPHNQVFFINSETGAITLISPLLDTGVNNYTVSS